MNFFDDKTIKKILYTFVGVLLVSIIVLVSIFIWYDNKISDENEEYSFTTDDYATVVLPNDDSKETSITEDKSINEIKNETNIVSNSDKENVNNTNIKSDKTVSTKKEDVESTIKNDGNEDSEKKVNKDLNFEAPVSGEITKDFASETLIYSKTLDEWTTHLGIDIKGDKTSIVKASESGTVESIKNDPRYGLTITISHNNGFKTVYSNLLTSEFVEEGDIVDKGDTIGTIGETASFEILDDSHLHFEIYKDEVPVNPTLYLK